MYFWNDDCGSDYCNDRAAAAMSIFSYGELNELIKSGTPAAVVSEISKTMLGAVGGTIAVIGVIVLPLRLVIRHFVRHVLSLQTISILSKRN